MDGEQKEMTKYNFNNFYDFIFDFVYRQPITDETIDLVLNTLSPREIQAIKLRFGLDCEPHTFKATGAKLDNLNHNKMGVTTERCRQMINKAARKLRHPSRCEVFITSLLSNLSGDTCTIIETNIYNELINNKTGINSINDTIETKDTLDIPTLCRPVEDLELTRCSTNCVRNENILFVGDLIQCNENQLLKIPGLGKKSFNYIKNILANYSLTLGTTVKNWEAIRPEKK